MSVYLCVCTDARKYMCVCVRVCVNECVSLCVCVCHQYADQQTVSSRDSRHPPCLSGSPAEQHSPLSPSAPMHRPYKTHYVYAAGRNTIVTVAETGTPVRLCVCPPVARHGRGSHTHTSPPFSASANLSAHHPCTGESSLHLLTEYSLFRFLKQSLSL